MLWRKGKGEGKGKGKPHSSSSGDELTLTVIQQAEPSHQRKLLSEERACPTCGFAIINPMTDKCPRCYSLVPLSDHTNCGECEYTGNCALAELKKKGEGRE